VNEELARHLSAPRKRPKRGVRRAHLVTRTIDGALLQELFHPRWRRHAHHHDIYEGLRPASIDDVVASWNWIAPLEAEGVLVRRSREPPGNGRSITSWWSNAMHDHRLRRALPV